MNKKAMAALKAMQKEITENIENLDWGGCGIFALTFYEAAIESGVAGLKIVFEANSYQEPKEMVELCDEINNGEKKELNAEEADDIVPKHIVLRDGLLCFDGNECYHFKPKLMDSHLTEITLDELKVIVSKGCFNDTYDKKQNDKLKAIIQKYFNANSNFHKPIKQAA